MSNYHSFSILQIAKRKFVVFEQKNSVKQGGRKNFIVPEIFMLVPQVVQEPSNVLSDTASFFIMYNFIVLFFFS